MRDVELLSPDDIFAIWTTDLTGWNKCQRCFAISWSNWMQWLSCHNQGQARWWECSLSWEPLSRCVKVTWVVKTRLGFTCKLSLIIAILSRSQLLWQCPLSAVWAQWLTSCSMCGRSKHSDHWCLQETTGASIPSQLREITSPEYPESALHPPPSRTCLKHLI